jgi:hypothetical protein
MELDIKNIDIKKLRRVSNFAKDKGILRTSAYRLIKENKIDHVTIDDVVFVVQNIKTTIYRKDWQR